MFNDKYGLTAAVLKGYKTMTRRIIKAPRRTIEGKEVCGFAINKTSDGVPYEVWLTGPDEESLCQLLPTYKVGEIVAVAQSYKSVFEESLSYALPRYHWLDDHIDEKGFENKMFVKASDMPHRIRITDIKVERLQDISEEDCLKEGVLKKSSFPKKKAFQYYFAGGKHEWDNSFSTPRKAFAALIDKVSGKGTWERNPWVFAYTFELID